MVTDSDLSNDGVAKKGTIVFSFVCFFCLFSTVTSPRPQIVRAIYASLENPKSIDNYKNNNNNNAPTWKQTTGLPIRMVFPGSEVYQQREWPVNPHKATVIYLFSL